MVNQRLIYGGMLVAGGIGGYLVDRSIADSPWRVEHRRSEYEFPVRWSEDYRGSYEYKRSEEGRRLSEAPGHGQSSALLWGTALGASVAYVGAAAVAGLAPTDRIARRFAPVVAMRGVAALGAGAFIGAVASRSIQG